MSRFKAISVKSGTIEGDVLKWALNGAKDYWTEESESKIRNGKCYDKIHEQHNKEYYIINSDEIIEDIIYRLDVQLPEIEDAPKYEIRAGKRVVIKLKEVIG